MNVSVPDGPPLAAANCAATPDGKLSTLTLGVPLAPLIVTGNWTAAPSCGTITSALPSVTTRVGGGVLEPLPHPASTTKAPAKTSNQCDRSKRAMQHLTRINRPTSNRLSIDPEIQPHNLR
jgi:hypothetical protein